MAGAGVAKTSPRPCVVLPQTTRAALIDANDDDDSRGEKSNCLFGEGKHSVVF